jgi:hypothetical protein
MPVSPKNIAPPGDIDERSDRCFEGSALLFETLQTLGKTSVAEPLKFSNHACEHVFNPSERSVQKQALSWSFIHFKVTPSDRFGARSRCSQQ